MSTEVFTLYEETTCGEALKTLQDQKDAEMVFYLYITNEDDSLVGVASLRALANPPDTMLKYIMEKKFSLLGPRQIKRMLPR